jgi:hypothetical protein
MTSTRLGHAVLLSLVMWCGASAAAIDQPPPDVAAIVRGVRESLRIEYTRPKPFIYLERGREVDVSMLGKVSLGPDRTFEVYPGVPGHHRKRLIAVDGKPLDPAELAKYDAEHQRHEREKAERERTETPRQRAARLRKAQEEVRERETILDDAFAVFQASYAGRDTIDGQPVVVLTLTPRPDARVTTREGGWMKQLQGRMWVAEAGHQIARIDLHAFEDVTLGWGVVARVYKGSGFSFIRRHMDGMWLPLEFTLEASGRTLLFRTFQFKDVTVYSNHRKAALTDTRQD